MNILVITLGTSDVQISSNLEDEFIVDNSTLKKKGLPDVHLKTNRSYRDTYLLESPRNDGQLIFDNYPEFEKVLLFPLITPLLNLFRRNEELFQEVWWVYTDQQTEREHFKNTDTLYFKSILQKYFEARYSNIHYYDYAITENVKDIDEQYKDFYRKTLFISNRRADIDRIFLLPQGGIDQINHALTLQLIQMFKSKVSVYQNAELSEPVQLQFPNLFLNDLTKHNVIKHIRDFDFEKAQDLILGDKEISYLASYASLRLNLLHHLIDEKKFPEEYELHWFSLNEIKQRRVKLEDLTYAFKIQMKQRKFSDALTKLFTVSENMFKQKIDEYSNENIASYYDNTLKMKVDVNLRWTNFIQTKLGNTYVNDLKDKKIDLSNPNAMAYSYLFRWLVSVGKIKIQIDDREIKLLNTVITDLRAKRNEINHHLGSITYEEINSIFSKRKISMEFFFQLLDAIVQTSGFGVYGQLQRKILGHYGESA
ncbi:MAG: hypothetical protein V4717_14875 [Bacteroidota bacterium]